MVNAVLARAARHFLSKVESLAMTRIEVPPARHQRVKGDAADDSMAVVGAALAAWMPLLSPRPQAAANTRSATTPKRSLCLIFIPPLAVEPHDGIEGDGTNRPLSEFPS